MIFEAFFFLSELAIFISLSLFRICAVPFALLPCSIVPEPFRPALSAAWPAFRLLESIFADGCPAFP